MSAREVETPENIINDSLLKIGCFNKGYQAGLEAAAKVCRANQMKTNDRFEVNAHDLDEREIRKLKDEE